MSCFSDSVPRPESSASAAAPGWSEDQLVRLEHEWRRLQRSFAYHPHVRIVSMKDDPPSEYEIELRVRTVYVSDSGQLQYTDSVPLRVSLGPGFPYTAPAVQPLKALFHPNVSWEGVHLNSAWQPTQTLAEYLRNVGDALAYRTYDPSSVVNPPALEWMEANRQLLPLDRTADLSPEAGGEPLERIMRHGPATLEQIRHQLDATRDALLQVDTAPGPAQVRDLARRTRLALNLFLEGDVPDQLRYQASELEDWARELPGSLPVWDYLRRQKAVGAALKDACAALDATRGPIQQALDAIEAMAPSSATVPDDLPAILASIPDIKSLESPRLKLPRLVGDADGLLDAIRQRLARLDAVAPLVAARDDSALARSLTGELENASSTVRQVRELAARVIEQVQPMLERARLEAWVVQRLAGWREYLDMLATGREMEQRIAARGADGIHAYMIENRAGRFGPFQFEQVMDLGPTRVALRSRQRHSIELFDASTTELLGRAEQDSLRVELPDQVTGEKHPITFRLGDRWDDLAVNFDFLVRQTGQAMTDLMSPGPECPGWAGRLMQALSRPAALSAIRDEHRRASHRWQVFIDDLTLLGLFKARLETWNLVQRIADVVPRIRKRLAEEQQRLSKCTADLASIVSRCGRDVENGQLVIPPRLVKSYNEQTELLDAAGRNVGNVAALLTGLGALIGRRMSLKGHFGLGGRPVLRLVPPLSDELAQLGDAMSNAALDQKLSSLENALNLRLGSDVWTSALRAGARGAETLAEPSPGMAVRVAASHEDISAADTDGPAAPEPLIEDFVIESTGGPEEERDGVEM